MKFISSKINGLKLIEVEPNKDDRGSFTRFFCENEFRAQNLETKFVQANSSFSANKGTLRGMHIQSAPHSEVKLVKCIRGSIFDVVVDLRKDSPTFKKWQHFIISAKNSSMIYVPKGCAHGFLTLEPNTEIIYLVSDFYFPSSETGFRFDDPSIGIKWPEKPSSISDKDLNFPKIVLDN